MNVLISSVVLTYTPVPWLQSWCLNTLGYAVFSYCMPTKSVIGGAWTINSVYLL